jgi:hypothetical protein
LLLEEELGDLYYHKENVPLLKSETGKGKETSHRRGT